MRASRAGAILGILSILSGTLSSATVLAAQGSASVAPAPLNLELSKEQIAAIENPYVNTGALNGAAEDPERGVLDHDPLLDWRQSYNPRTNEPFYVNERGEMYAPGMAGGSATTLTTGMALLVLPFDRAGLDLVQRHGGKIVDQASDFGEKFGGNLAGKVIGAGYIFIAILDDNNQVKSVWTTLFKAAVATKIVTDWTKGVFSRSLPSESRDPYRQTWNSNAAAQDLPSGHAATATSAATVFAEAYKDQYPWVPYVAYALAGLTAYSRVRQNQHWPSAVFLGMAVGHGSAMAVIHSDETRSRWYITPVAGPGFGGIHAVLIEGQPSRPCQFEGQRRESFERCLRRGFKPKPRLFN